jgi:hypothetical protein
MRTLTLDMLENRARGPFIAGEDMVSYRQGKEIAKGKQAYLLDSFEKILNSISDDTRITVVDCHI